jgi:hypothetical protein
MSHSKSECSVLVRRVLCADRAEGAEPLRHVETIIVEPSFETSRWAYKHPFRLCRAPLYNLELVRAQSSSMTD